jgi:hypothetical protein
MAHLRFQSKTLLEKADNPFRPGALPEDDGEILRQAGQNESLISLGTSPAQDSGPPEILAVPVFTCRRPAVKV